MQQNIYDIIYNSKILKIILQNLEYFIYDISYEKYSIWSIIYINKIIFDIYYIICNI